MVSVSLLTINAKIADDVARLPLQPVFNLHGTLSMPTWIQSLDWQALENLTSLQ